MGTYLSIDIDFWNDLDAAEKALSRLLIRRGSIPTRAVMNHQQLLQSINRSGADLLVNVDEHSDLADTDITIFECGTWVSYVKWRTQGSYLWIRNQRGTSHGSCNHGQKTWNMGSDWWSSRSVFETQEVNLCPYLRDCVGIGLCLSPSFCVSGAKELFEMLVKAFHISYTEGQANEYSNRQYRRPPDIKAA
jgi:hypothetical protein